MKIRYPHKLLCILLAAMLFVEPVIAYAQTGGSGITVGTATGAMYSEQWIEDQNGWHLRDRNGAFIAETWVNDLTSGETGGVWYLLDETGRMADSPFILTPEGDLYALNMEHNGHFGMMLQEDFYLDGRLITVNKVHDGTFGKILLQEDKDYILGRYTVLTVTVPTDSIVTVGRRYTGSGDSSSSWKKDEDEPQSDPQDSLKPEREMGFEEVSQEFTLFVKSAEGAGSESEIRNILKITDVSSLDEKTRDHKNITFNLSEEDDGIYMIWPDYEDGFGDRVHIYEPGHTYTAELPEDCGYILGATPFPDYDPEIIWAADTIICVNFYVYADDIFDAELDPSVIFISSEEVSGLSEEAFGGVCSAYVNEDGTISAETTEAVTGTFTYGGDLNVGDTVAIYVGEKPFTDGDDMSMYSTDVVDDLAYLTVTDAEGDKYTYRTADMDEVLFIPGITLIEKKQIIGGDIPTAAASDKKGKEKAAAASPANASAASPADASAASPADASPEGGEPRVSDPEITETGTLTVNKKTAEDENGKVSLRDGDFLAIYDKNGTEDDVIYALVTGTPKTDGDLVTIEYEVISYGAMKDMYSMHYSVPVDMALTDDQLREKEREITDALLANDGEILSSLVNAGIEDYIKSDEFAQLTGEPVLMATAPSGSSFMDGTLSNRVKIKEYPVPSVYVKNDQELTAFDRQYKGLLVSIRLIFEICIDEKFNVRLELEYEQQYAVDYDIDGSVTAERKFLGIPDPTSLDANVTVSIDTHSFYHFHMMIRGETAMNSTFDESRLDKDEQDFIKEFDKAQGVITELAKPFGLEYVKDYILDDLGETGDMQLKQMAQAYASYMGRSNTMGWFTCPPIELFQVSHRVIYKLVQIRLRGDLCAQVKVNAQLYLEYNARSAERVTYTVTLRKQLSKAKEIKQLMPPESQFGLYVFGHAGFRIGIKVTAEIGLIHVKVAKAAIIAELGLYAELLGVFAYYHNEIGNDSENVAFGFMNFETGFYVIVTALAQALNMRQLLVTKQLVDKKYPFLTLGIETICFEFEMAEREPDLLTLEPGTDTDLPSKYLRVKELALNTGLISVKDLTETWGCGNVSVRMDDSFYLETYVYDDKITFHAYSSSSGTKGNVTLHYDPNYNFLDGVLGTIPGFSLTFPAEISSFAD